MVIGYTFCIGYTYYALTVQLYQANKAYVQRSQHQPGHVKF